MKYLQMTFGLVSPSDYDYGGVWSIKCQELELSSSPSFESVELWVIACIVLIFAEFNTVITCNWKRRSSQSQHSVWVIIISLVE